MNISRAVSLSEILAFLAVCAMVYLIFALIIFFTFLKKKHFSTKEKMLKGAFRASGIYLAIPFIIGMLVFMMFGSERVYTNSVSAEVKRVYGYERIEDGIYADRDGKVARCEIAETRRGEDVAVLLCDGREPERLPGA